MSSTPRIPWHRNPRVRGYIAQAALVILAVWALGTIFSNTVQNLQQRGIQTGIGFLDNVAPFGVGYTPFLDYELGSSTYWRVFFIGIQNTLVVSILGIVSATIIGFIVGVSRLSPNWLVSRLALIYIETFRNIPLLLQIMFWNFAVFLPLFPNPRQSLSFADSLFLNTRGLYVPKPVIEDAAGIIAVLVAALAALAGAVYLQRWAKRRQDETGERFPAKLAGLGLIIVIVGLAMAFAGGPIALEFPILERFNLAGGIEVPLPLFSLWFALTTYTAAFIAENVRGGILAVSHGQTEAAGALGLPRNLMMRMVIIPQAMRIIVPPTISQFLNLTKNSSLAVAIAYEELVNLWAGISLNQTGQALVIIAMTIGVYECLSLMTSAILNYYNKRVQLADR